MSRDIKPHYSRNQVNKAGKNIRNKNYSVDDLVIINNWRAAHNHILNTWQKNLRNRITNKKTIFAQRLKQKKTILNKLKRQPNMALSTMHDIAGCRLIFHNLKELHNYRKKLHTQYRFEHYLEKPASAYDYLSNPKNDGYRGIHDVYICKYRDSSGQDWNGLKVEIQYRTKVQHSWATSVEIADTLTGNRIKFGKGSETQKEFFKITSEMLARCYEESNSCYPELTNQQVLDKFRSIEKDIKLLEKLSTLKMINSYKTIAGKTLILHFTTKGTIYISEYDSMSKATSNLIEIENRAGDDDHVVLVRAGSDTDIKRAYNNYFRNPDNFVKFVRRSIDFLEEN